MKKLSKAKQERFNDVEANIKDTHNLIKASRMTATYLIRRIDELITEAAKIKDCKTDDIMASYPKMFDVKEPKDV